MTRWAGPGTGRFFLAARTWARDAPLWPQPEPSFRGLFRAIDEDNAGLNIPACNGGLFTADPALDALHVPDEVCAYFKDLGDYDYRPAREVAEEDENTEVRSGLRGTPGTSARGITGDKAHKDARRARSPNAGIGPMAAPVLGWINAWKAKAAGRAYSVAAPS